jgi:hypothetical protein
VNACSRVLCTSLSRTQHTHTHTQTHTHAHTVRVIALRQGSEDELKAMQKKHGVDGEQHARPAKKD